MKLFKILVLVMVISSCGGKNTVGKNTNGNILFDIFSNYNSKNLKQLDVYIDKSLGYNQKIKQEFDYFDNINITFTIKNIYKKNDYKIIEFLWEKNAVLFSDTKSYMKPSYGKLNGNTFSAEGTTVFKLKKINGLYKVLNITGDKIFGL